MRRRQLSILLIDDDEADRLIVKRSLEQANFCASLTEAVNGREAIIKLNEEITKQNNNFDDTDENIDISATKYNFLNNNYPHNFDLILLDYLLPDMDGIHLLREFKKIDVDLPIIVLTRQEDEQIAVEMMKTGAVDYLSKRKIDAETLARAISQAIRFDQAEKAVKLANEHLRVSNELLISKNKDLERQKQQIKLKNMELQESSKLKSDFLAIMSHELRTPMNAILGFSQLLLRQHNDPLSAQQHNLVERIFQNSHNLLNMINEILDFSKIDAGQLELNRQRFDLASLVKVTVEELRSLAIKKQLGLVADIQLQDNFILQDSSFVKRIVINLLSNAIKFTESGQVKVQIKEIGQTTIVIAVSDTGIGIAPEDHKKIFEAFRQADQSYSRQHLGTGLGLAITDSLAKIMGGKISVNSILGQGSTFTVEIPRKYDG